MKIHHLQGYIQSIYLIEYSDKLLLLDSGYRADVAMVLDFIENTLHRSRYDLKVVVISHAHPDHAGGARLFKKLTQCQITSKQLSHQWYGGIKGFINFIIDLVLAIFMAYHMSKKIKNLPYLPYIYPDIILHEGDRLPNFLDWQIIDTAGHTDRDISLHHLPSHHIYIADVLIKLKHKYVPPYLIHDPIQYRYTLEKLQQINHHASLLAHGNIQIVTPMQWGIVINTVQPQDLWRSIKQKVFSSLDDNCH